MALEAQLFARGLQLPRAALAGPTACRRKPERAARPTAREFLIDALPCLIDPYEAWDRSKDAATHRQVSFARATGTEPRVTPSRPPCCGPGPGVPGRADERYHHGWVRAGPASALSVLLTYLRDGKYFPLAGDRFPATVTSGLPEPTDDGKSV